MKDVLNLENLIGGFRLFFFTGYSPAALTFLLCLLTYSCVDNVALPGELLPR